MTNRRILNIQPSKIKNYIYQWGIQDFTDRNTNSHSWGGNLLFWPFFQKLHEFFFKKNWTLAPLSTHQFNILCPSVIRLPNSNLIRIDKICVGLCGLAFLTSMMIIFFTRKQWDCVTSFSFWTNYSIIRGIFEVKSKL